MACLGVGGRSGLLATLAGWLVGGGVGVGTAGLGACLVWCWEMDTGFLSVELSLGRGRAGAGV